MKVVTFNKRILIQRPGEQHMIVCNPGTRYLIDDKLFLDLVQSDQTSGRIYRFSDGPPFCGIGGGFDGDRLLFSRLRGIGDELCMSGVVHYFSEQGCECSVLCTSLREPIWRNNPDVFSLVSEPLALDTVWRAQGQAHYDRMFHMESLIESNQEPDQENIYDMMYRFCGVDPDTVPDRCKRPYIYLSDEEIDSVQSETPFIFYQLHASNLTRSIPEHKTIEVLGALDSQELPVWVFGTQISDRIKDFIDLECKHVYRVFANDIRSYFSCINRSKLVIGPDSSAIHAASAFGKPAIGFWGPFDPKCRVMYYQNHFPIWDQAKCRKCPCYPPTKDLPLHLCPKGEKQTSCEVFESINGQHVLDLAKSLLG